MTDKQAEMRAPQSRNVRRSWYNPLAISHSIMIRRRLWVSALAGFVVLFLTAGLLPNTERISIAWDVFGLSYLAFAFHLIATCRPEHIREKAFTGDDSRVVILALILLSIAASFAAIAQLIGQAKQIEGTERIGLAVLALVTIILSWSVTQTAFTLHYAHEYYLPDHESDAANGLDFPGGGEPDYWDFLYFATSIGATSQTSDTAIRSHSLRRLVTIHAVIAFFFNTAVLALSINIAASLL